MVIVHPDEVARLAVARDRLGVALVHCLVGFPEGRLEVAEALQVMKQRPDDLVGIAVIKLVAFCFAQCHWHHLVACVARGFGGRSVRDLTCDPGPTDPRAAASTQHRPERTNEPAGSRRSPKRLVML